MPIFGGDFQGGFGCCLGFQQDLQRITRLVLDRFQRFNGDV